MVERQTRHNWSDKSGDAQEKQKRDINTKIERLYYKPHLGPEETDEKLDKEDDRLLKSK